MTVDLSVYDTDNHAAQEPGSMFWCHAMIILQFGRALSFACRGRLRTLLADCSAVGLYCATITRQQIFKCSLQVTLEGLGSSAPTAFFSTQIRFVSRPGCWGRNEVSWHSGQKASLAPPCSNLRSFRSKGTFRNKCAIVIQRPGYCSPCPLVRPCWVSSLLMNNRV